MMKERDELIEELKHLVRYYQQAAHEFFDDASGELEERLTALYGCLEKNQNSLEEYRKMIEFLIPLQNSLKNRVNDLVYLTERMTHLLNAPPNEEIKA